MNRAGSDRGELIWQCAPRGLILHCANGRFWQEAHFSLGLSIVLMKSRLLRVKWSWAQCCCGYREKVLPVAWLSDARSFVAKGAVGQQ